MNMPARSEEAPFTLDSESHSHRSLGLRDQFSLWSSLGVSLLIPATAVFVVKPVADKPALTTAAVTLAVLLGTVVGSALLALAAAISATTGTAAMVTLRGLLGRRGSIIPTSLNLLQCCGWAALEVYVIAGVATALSGGEGRLWWTLAAGAVATLMAVRPIRSVKVIRRYLMWLVFAATLYLLWHVLTNLSEPAVTDVRTWDALWPAFDIVVTLPVSWAVLAGDWSRLSTSKRATFVGVGAGYAVTCAAFFLIGVFAVMGSPTLATQFSPSAFVNGLLVLPIGALALALLAVDEVDEAFANIYSTAVSAQNLVGRWDRRVLAVGIGVFATAVAVVVNLESYEAFLLLIGALFLPLVVVLITDWYLVRRVRAGSAGIGFSVTEPSAPVRRYFAVWLMGVCVYSVVSPAQVPGWVTFWEWVASRVPWMTHISASATALTVVVTGVATLSVGLTYRR